MEPVDIEQMIHELRGLFEGDLKGQNIELILDTALPVLNAERPRLRQVFQNLIDNAIKYMGDGVKREIHVGCKVGETEVEFYVRDTGIGIDPEDLGKVFHVFRRGKNTAAANIPGQGVGLASVKSIVETYNGTIWVESELGKGTTFRFTINGKYMTDAVTLEHNAASGGDEEQTEADAPQASPAGEPATA
jgi:signal transduction histidine kinase